MTEVGILNGRRSESYCIKYMKLWILSSKRFCLNCLKGLSVQYIQECLHIILRTVSTQGHAHAIPITAVPYMKIKIQEPLWIVGSFKEK